MFPYCMSACFEYQCLHILVCVCVCVCVCVVQLDDARKGNKEGSRERNEKVAAAQAKIEV